MKIGFIGLGKMGSNMVIRLLEHKQEVVVWNRSADKALQFKKNGAQVSESLDDLVLSLSSPRIIWLMLTAGDAVENTLESLSNLLSPEDLIIDGGNSFYKDTLRRYKKLQQKGIKFMDVGVSGGPEGARSGSCMMIGGDKKDFFNIEPILKILAAPGAYDYLGSVGAGQFAKMIHNGIEYGMMEAIAEGAAILKFSQFNFDIEKVFRLYANKSVIESRLTEWARQALSEDKDLSSISSVIGHSGEGEWTIAQAKEENIKTPVVQAAVEVRLRSSDDSKDSKESFRNKVVSALRGKFGQHRISKI